MCKKYSKCRFVGEVFSPTKLCNRVANPTSIHVPHGNLE